MLLLFPDSAFCILNSEFEAGVARVDITPPAVGTPMGGYSDRAGPSTGIHDRLTARVLLLKAGQESVAFITCDLRSFVGDRVRQRAMKDLGVGHVLVSSSHTHSGPLTWENRTSRWYTQTEDKLVAAIAEAQRNLKSVTLAVGRGSVYLGHNRRKIAANGRAVMFWRNELRVPTAPVDPSVTVLRVDDAAGKTLAVVVHYACHPSVLGPDNREISADYPGAMSREVEQQFPGALGLFWQGAAGDTNPYRDKEPVPDGFVEAERVGRALAAEAVRVARKATTVSGEMHASTEVVELKNRWDPAKSIHAGLTAVTLGTQVALISLPGEPFVDHQIALTAKSEVPFTMLLGYSSGVGGEWIGYLPTIDAAVSGGYGAGWNTTVEVGAGEALVDRGLVRIYQLLGRLTTDAR